MIKKLENVYRFTDLLEYGRVSFPNEKHLVYKALEGWIPEYRHYPSIYRHTATEEDINDFLSEDDPRIKVGDSWFESGFGPSKEDDLAYRIITKFMEEENIFSMVLV